MPALPTTTALDTIVENLYTPEEDLKALPISPQTVQRIMRIREMYTFWMANPHMEEEDIRSRLEEQFALTMGRGMGVTQAAADMQVLKAIVGMLNQDVKAWHAFRFNKQIRKLYKKAIAAKDYKTAERCLSDYAKYNRLDQNEQQLPDYSQIKPGEWTPTTDPRAAGFEPMKELTKEVERMKRILLDGAEDATYEEVEEAIKESGERKEAE